MSFEVTTVEGYLTLPKTIGTELDAEFPELISAQKKLLSRSCELTFGKWRSLKALGRVLVDKGVIKPFMHHLKWTLKPMAYMREADGIFISVGLILTRSPWTLMSVYLHEISHVWLSEREEYSSIKALQREFRKRFSDNKLCERMSPIELYSEMATVKFLRAIYNTTEKPRQRKRIGRLLSEREKRVELLLSEISKLEAF